MFHEHILLMKIGGTLSRFPSGCSPRSWTLYWLTVSCLGLCVLWCQQWELLTFFRGPPLGYWRCFAHPASRDPEVPGNLCLLAQPGAGSWQCGCVEAPLTCFQVGQSMCHHSCHRSPQNQTGAGTGSKIATSWDLFLLSCFPILLLFLWEFFLSKRRAWSI